LYQKIVLFWFRSAVLSFRQGCLSFCPFAVWEAGTVANYTSNLMFCMGFCQTRQKGHRGITNSQAAHTRPWGEAVMCSWKLYIGIPYSPPQPGSLHHRRRNRVSFLLHGFFLFFHLLFFVSPFTLHSISEEGVIK